MLLRALGCRRTVHDNAYENRLRRAAAGPVQSSTGRRRKLVWSIVLPALYIGTHARIRTHAQVNNI